MIRIIIKDKILIKIILTRYLQMDLNNIAEGKNQMAESVAKDYSKYLNQDIENKLKPVNQIIESMLARLEEFETLVNFAKQDVDESTEALSSLVNCNDQMKELFSKIDSVERVVNHIKGNLKNLEEKIEKEEHRLGLNDSKLVTNIFSPLLFRKSDKNTVVTNVPIFNVKEYFKNEIFDEESEKS
ncbi:hypothetical protein HHI36_020514 [Cryptolaemus montrouzieri]|uniref:Biogenesis of lysosome-related organelles complex 1 subunit 4 n=1 Tax=Cryptolaemus montrouzieri TaxID=559131 RepID=A0ABD2NAY3_9CUCU